MVDRSPAVKAGYRILTPASRHIVSRELSADMKSQIAVVRSVFEAEAGLHIEADGEPSVGYLVQHSASLNFYQYDSMVRIGIDTLVAPDSDAVVSVIDHIRFFAPNDVVEAPLDADGGAVADDVVDAASDTVVEPVLGTMIASHTAMITSWS